MYEYLYSNLIKCARCGGNYRGKKDRNTPVYICSEYNNKKLCERGAIKEIIITTFVKKYCEQKNIKFQFTNKFMKSIIKEIKAGTEVDIEIEYNDGYTQHYKNNDIKF